MEQPSKNIVSGFEITVIAALTIAAVSNALSYGTASLISLLHAGFLITVFALTRMAIGRLNQRFGQLFFCICCLFLTTEILIQHLTGLHLNFFIISLLLQPNASQNIGFSLPLTLLAASTVFVGFFIATRKLGAAHITLSLRTSALTAFAFAVLAQLGHGYLFYQGEADVMAVRRNLPFFFAPHPYQVKKLYGALLGSNGENPFSVPNPIAQGDHNERDTPRLTQKKNILLIVADSVRASDIAENPALTPNLMRWSEKGWLNLNHYSVSNCTHFSMYSMLTGRLPTNFTSARAANHATGLLPTLATNGYQLSTSEAFSLNWYGLADIIIPAGTQRTLISVENAVLADKEVTASTIKALRDAKETSTPAFHLAYYYGSHYPYSGLAAGNGFSGLKVIHTDYLTTIEAFDTEFGSLMNSLEAEGLLEDTIIVVTSDHGDEFGENGIIGHSSNLSDAQVKVPFMVIGAGTEKPTYLNSHLDLMTYLLGELTNTHAPLKGDEVAPIILANCSYEYPDGFSVLDNGERFDFSYDDGYLTPLDAHAAPKQLRALKTLLAAIEESGK